MSYAFTAQSFKSNNTNSASPDSHEVVSSQQASSTTFYDQRQLIVEPSNRHGNMNNRPQEMSLAMTELPNNTNHIFGKPTLINTFVWDNASPRGTILYQVDLPDVLALLPEVPSATLLETIHTFRTDFNISARCNSVKTQQGRLIAFWIPMDIRLTTEENIYTAQNYPHVKIDASNSSNVMLDIAFESIQTMLSTNVDAAFDTLGKIVFMVLNPLATGLESSSSTSATISVVLEPKNHSLHLTGLRHTPIIPDFRLSNLLEEPSYNLTPKQRSNVVRRIPTITKEMDMIKQVISEGKDTIEDLASGNFGSIFSRIGGHLTDWGLDKPVEISDFRRSTGLAMSPINSGTGVSYVEVLDIDNIQMDVTPKTLTVASDDPMNLLNLVNRYSMINQLTWSAASAPGTYLMANTPVTPMLTPGIPVPDAPNLYDCSPTFLAHNTAPFLNWTGGIDVRLEVVNTFLHSGRFWIGWIPNETTTTAPSTLTVTEAMTYPGVLVDIEQASEASFNIAYNKITPWSFTSHDINSIGQYYYLPEFATTTKPDTHMTCNGVFFVMVINELRQAGPVADTVEINVYIKGSKDFKMRARNYAFRTGGTILHPPAPTIKKEMSGAAIESQSALIAASDEQPIASSQATALQTTVASDFHPDITRTHELHLSSLLKSYVYKASVDLKDNVATICRPITHLVVPTLSANYFGICSSLDTIGHFASQFTFMRGGMNYKLLFDSNKNTGVTGVIQHVVRSDTIPEAEFYQIYGWRNNYAQYSQPFNLAYQCSVQVAVPYKSPYERILIAQNNAAHTKDPTSDSLGEIQMYFFSDTTGYLQDGIVHFYRAMADDFNFSLVVSPPVQRMSTLVAN